MSLIEIENLWMTTGDEDAVIDILKDVSLTIEAGECVALVGESGSGKSMTAKCVLGLVPAPLRVSGSVRYGGKELLTESQRQLVRLRQTDFSMIYQDPRAGINPMQRIGDFLLEGVTHARLMSREEARSRALELMHAVRLRDPEDLWSKYPIQLSGGMLQRIMIVSALMPKPKVLLCDEPTTALDVTTQAEVIGILKELQASESLAMLFITHDLDLAASIATRVSVMYAGRVLETGPADRVLSRPEHPYTRALLGARPRLEADSRERLQVVTEEVRALSEKGGTHV